MGERYLHTDVVPNKIAREWFDRGQKEDTLFKFVSYWIVFNHLYNLGVIDLESKSERDRVTDYCKNHMKTLEKELKFNELELNEFYANPVIPGSRIVEEILPFDSKDRIKEKILNVLSSQYNRGPSRRNRQGGTAERIAEEYLNIRGGSKRDKILSLFSAIYTVRCNLFHGNKAPDPGRDYNLVEESAAVLEMCLPALIEETFSK